MNKRQFKKLAIKTVIYEALIPKQTPYCYSVDREKIKTEKSVEDIPIIPCPYYYVGDHNQYGCLKEAFFGESLDLYDMTKICGTNKP